MGKEICILFEGAELRARLNDSPTARAIEEALPFEGRANRWGEEIYFTIPVQVGEAADARQDMEVGELGYWPVGAAFCIFFGPTPVSNSDRPRAYSNVNPFGRLEGDEEELRRTLSSVKEGDTVRVELAAEPGA